MPDDTPGAGHVAEFRGLRNLLEIHSAQVVEGSAELAKRAERRLGVGGRSFDPDVQVFREARLGVEGDGVAADDEILNPTVV